MTAKKLQPNQLPGWPERMSAQLSSAYMGVSVSKFLQLVKEGAYPAPESDGGSTLWHKTDLDAHLAMRRPGGALSSPSGPATTTVEEWLNALEET